MARTGKYGLIAVLGVTAAVLVIVVTIRSIAFNVSPFIGKPAEWGEMMNTSLSLDEPETLVIDGFWSVQLLPLDGAGERIELTAPELIIDRVKTSRGSSLRLPAVSGFFGNSSKSEARIYSNSIEEISINGAGSFHIQQGSFDELSISLDGAASIEVDESRIGSLELSISGAGSADFMESSVVNADLDIDGAGSVRLNMAGGALTGSLDGVGSVEYRGEVSQRDFDIDGLGSLKYLD